MDQVISSVTTPLALAALGLLLGAGIVRLILRNSESRIGKTTVQYGFWFAVILSVLANLVFAYQTSLKAESLITGVVQSKSGDYLPYTIVDVRGKARAITDDNGTFSMSIPRSRMEDEFELDVSKPGYEQKTVVVKSAERSVKITLSLKQLVVDEFLSISSNVAIAHYMGLPQIDLQITMSNPTHKEIAVTDITLSLLRREPHEQRTLAFQSVYFDTNVMTYMEVFEPIRIPSEEARRAFHVFVPPNHEVSRFVQRIRNLVEELGIAYFRLERRIISDDEAASLHRKMEARWFWYPGQYEIVFSCTANGKRYQVAGSFQLLEDDIYAMKNISKYYASGFGLLYGSHLPYIRDARPGLIVQSDFVYGVED